MDKVQQTSSSQCYIPSSKPVRIQETNCCLAFRMLLPSYRNMKTNSGEQHAIFAHELQSALRLTVGFSNIYCERNLRFSGTLRSVDW
jgi:hypothetical protein